MPPISHHAIPGGSRKRQLSPRPALRQTPCKVAQRQLDKARPQPTPKASGVLTATSWSSTLRTTPSGTMTLPVGEDQLQQLKPSKADNESTSSSTTESEETRGRKPRERVLHRRKRQRLRKYLDLAMAAHRRGTTFLKEQAVTYKVQKYYRKEVDQFKEFARRRSLPIKRSEQIDEALVVYLNHLFWLGNQPHRGDKLLAGLLHAYPEFGKYGSRKVPRTWRALRGWRRLCPGRSRKPFPLAVWAAVASELRRRGYVSMAVFVLVALSSYSRPSELLRCTVYSLVPPLRNTLNEWSLLLSPEQEGHPSKTGEYDTSLTLDSPWGPVVFQAS